MIVRARTVQEVKMSEQVKRYAFRLSQLSEVMGGRLEVVEYSGDGLPYVLATDYDALHAEAEALRAENAKLRTALAERDAVLRDWHYAARVRPSCQAGVVERCRCITCCEKRGNALLSSAEPVKTAPERYTCIGKGGEYELLGIASGAGTLNGLSHMVYRNRDGVMFVREPEDFLSRMEKLPAKGGDGEVV